MFYSIHSPILSIRTYSLNILIIVPTDDIDTHDTSKKHRRTNDIAKKFRKIDGISGDTGTL